MRIAVHMNELCAKRVECSCRNTTSVHQAFRLSSCSLQGIFSAMHLARAKAAIAATLPIDEMFLQERSVKASSPL
jgi:hypothetical protein